MLPVCSFVVIAGFVFFLFFETFFWLWHFWRLARNCFALFALVYSALSSVDCFTFCCCCCFCCCCAESATSVCSPLDMHTLQCAGRVAGVFLFYCCCWPFATFDMAQLAFLLSLLLCLDSISLFNYWFMAILLAEVIQCQLWLLLLQGIVPCEMRCSMAFCTAIQLLFNCCFDVFPDELDACGMPNHACPCTMPSSRSFVLLPQCFAPSWVALSCLRHLIKNLISSLHYSFIRLKPLKTKTQRLWQKV